MSSNTRSHSDDVTTVDLVVVLSTIGLESATSLHSNGIATI